MSPTTYEIDITMSEDTVTTLFDGAYNLYGFKAVQASQSGGSPLVWFTLAKTGYSATTKLTWSVQYEAYTSHTSIIPNGQVQASFSTQIGLGQTLEVGVAGEGNVKDVGTAQAISLLNTTSTPFTCGIAQHSADGNNNPMCAFPLYGRQLDVIAPIEKVLLMFSSMPVNTGTVIEQAYGPGVLVDLTGASTNTRQVSYDINAGWSGGGYSGAQAVTADANLVPLLITSGTGADMAA